LVRLRFLDYSGSGSVGDRPQAESQKLMVASPLCIKISARRIGLGIAPLQEHIWAFLVSSIFDLSALDETALDWCEVLRHEQHHSCMELKIIEPK
jgi:hypothetical protein